ncbi:MAG: DUF1272 domain-containing protein [Nevskiales bacterium]
MLKMKSNCETCGTDLAPSAVAYICSYECTFCASCAQTMQHICPNCSGELVWRPTRVLKPLAVASGLLKRRVQRLLQPVQL